MLEQKIVNFINHVATSPFENIYDIATKYFSGREEGHITRKIVVPEMLKLTPAKRKLVTNIIREKTNCEVSSSDDYSKNYIKIREAGEVIKELPEQLKKLKWLFK